MAVDGESHWMLLSGEDLICSDPFRISLFHELNKRGYKVENKFDSKISYKETH